MRLALLSPLCVLALAAASPPAAQFGLACTGNEVLQSANGVAKQAPYSLTLSIDLTRKLYCYGACGREQTFAIPDAASTPIKLADVETPAQSRHILFDPARMILTDDQRISMGALPAVRRHARALCKAAPYHAPPSL